MGLKVLSLFDGMSNGQLALRRLGVKDYTYYAFQIKPLGYTDCVSYNQAQDLLGDGWTVDVIVHILSFIGVNNENN